MKINFISNLSLKETSGGISAINHAIHSELNKYFDVNYIGEINPGFDYFAKIPSNAKKVLGIKRNYHFFSNRRLNQIKNQLNKAIIDPETPCFFHGFTPWIKYNSSKVYYVLNDACFATYVRIYNNESEFNKNDLKRIYDQEASWLLNAKKVFFSSKWALEETKKHYHLDGNNFRVVGQGGFIDIPEKDIFNKNSGKKFLFISREFIPKGGQVVAEAFSKLKEKHPEIELNVIGEKPPEDVLKKSGINYLGFLHKNVKAEKEFLINIFANTFVLVHPTIKDTTTLVINELGYYGVPSISSKLFAIPEYVLDGTTGFLLDNPRNVPELCEKMELLIKNESLYSSMRKEAFQFSHQNTWAKVGNRLIEEMKSHAQ